MIQGQLIKEAQGLLNALKHDRENFVDNARKLSEMMKEFPEIKDHIAASIVDIKL